MSKIFHVTSKFPKPAYDSNGAWCYLLCEFNLALSVLSEDGSLLEFCVSSFRALIVDIYSNNVLFFYK